MYIKSIALVLLFEAIVLQVNGVPLKVVGPSDEGSGSSEDRTRVKTATSDAHDLVLKMEKVHADAANGDASAKSKVQQAFGTSANMDGIGQNIQTLKTGKFYMDNAKSPTHTGPGYYDPGKNRVEFGSGFHLGTTPEQRAGMVLHEASHAVIGTKDIFNSKGEPTSQTKMTNPGDKSGYKDSHLPEMLKDEKFSKNLHQNADSWRVFGDLCRRALERRALAEPDLMKREEILQSRAASCALPPRKTTTAADKPTANKPAAAANKPTANKPAAAANKPATRGAANKPTANKPAANKPAANKPATRAANKPAANKPAANKPATRTANKPAANKPAANKPAANKPAANKPATRAANKPTANKPAANKPAANKPVAAANKPVAVANKPAANKPVAAANKPAANKPVAAANKPVAAVNKPAANKPVAAANKPANQPAANKPANQPAANKPANQPVANKPANKSATPPAPAAANKPAAAAPKPAAAAPKLGKK